MSAEDSLLLTKIIATLGPACGQAPVLTRLVEEGARVFRINFSHGSPQEHLQLLHEVRRVSAQTGVPLGVIGDLPGPKVRLGQVNPSQIELREGDRVVFSARPIVGCRDEREGVVRLSATYAGLAREVNLGQRVLIDDGAVRMLVVEKSGQGDEAQLICQVTVGGPISSAKGVNLPDTELEAPSMTPRDRACVDWALEHQLDYVALSFVRRAEDVGALRAAVAGRSQSGGGAMGVIAKIEKPQAIEDLAAIIDASDAVMVARGDLGVEMDLAEVPVIQKRIINECHERGRPVIVATQMLQSMIQSASPTRAEVSDVANAIFDGADAVMLSGETAVGKHPVQAVRVMARTAYLTAEHMKGDARWWSRPPRGLSASRYRPAALAHGVGAIVRGMQAKYVVSWTESGDGVLYLSQNRLPVPIIAASDNAWALRRMSLLFGVMPVAMDQPADGAAFIQRMDALVQERNWARQGDVVVVVKGEPLGISGVTNQIQIHYVGDVCGAQRPLDK